MNKIQLCGMLLFCSNDTYFTAGSPHPPPPPLPGNFLKHGLFYSLVREGRGHLCGGGKREEWVRNAKKAKGVRRLGGGRLRKGNKRQGGGGRRNEGGHREIRMVIASSTM